jgi:hypothetical protein
VGLFGRKHQDEPENAAGGGNDGAFEVVDAAGKRIRYTPADFDEIFTTTDEREMRRHVGIGWLLLDEWVGRDPGRTASWVDTGLRRADGRVLKHYHSLVNAISGDARRFAPYEHVHRVRLWLEEFRIGRELSQTLKLRGHEFLHLYSCEIDELYAP